MEHFDVEKSPIEGEAAWASAVQLLMNLKDINEKNVASKKGSDNATIGVQDLQGEALFGKDLKSILYCSLGK